ncbi:hypothetical protein C8R46DRAFT_1188615 [Mycena filopes]|nr:hypothetical protein C8R46DRAFT_1188615 [Mycena filopes]
MPGSYNCSLRSQQTALRIQVASELSAPPTLAIPPPGVASLLTSNDPPSESEIPRILDLISDAQDRIDALDPQIRALQARLASLVRERHETTNYVRHHRTILSPLRRVPPEVLCEIFAWSVYNSGEREEPPWYLGHVCRSWRGIALAYPRLWTHLTIGEDLPRIQAQLLRAGNALLEVYWSGVRNNRNTGLADLMGPYYRRWRGLHLEACEFTDIDAPEWLCMASGHLDQLTTVEFTDSEDGNLPDFLSVAPNLRRVILNGLDSTVYSPWIPIPWVQITHYRGTFHPERQAEILEVAQNLLVCSVGFIGIFNPTPLVTLPRLRRLSTESASFLPYLTTPALQELTSLYTEPEAMPLLSSFISSSCCTLTTLALFRCYLDTVFLSVLHAVPSLAHLFIECDDVSQFHTAIFRAMTLSTPPLICPSLTSLVYGYRRPLIAPEQEFFDMVRSRFTTDDQSDGLHNLNRLRIFLAHGATPPQRVTVAIAQLRADGFDAAFVDGREAKELKRSHQF